MANESEQIIIVDDDIESRSTIHRRNKVFRSKCNRIRGSLTCCEANKRTSFRSMSSCNRLANAKYEWLELTKLQKLTAK